MLSIPAVDDAAAMRQRLVFTLTSPGFQAVEAIDGQCAWGQADQRGVNLVLTTESSARIKTAGRDAGATGWIVKPLAPAMQIEVIGQVVR